MNKFDFYHVLNFLFFSWEYKNEIGVIIKLEIWNLAHVFEGDFYANENLTVVPDQANKV